MASPPRAVPAEARPGQAAPGGLTSKLFAFYVVFEEQSGVGLTRDRSVHRPHLLGEKLRRSEGRGRGPSPGSPRSSAPCHLPTSPPLLIPGKTLSTPKTHTFYTLTGCGGALLSPAVRQRGFKDLSFGSGAAFPAARPSSLVVAQLVSVPTPHPGPGLGGWASRESLPPPGSRGTPAPHSACTLRVGALRFPGGPSPQGGTWRSRRTQTSGSKVQLLCGPEPAPHHLSLSFLIYKVL